MRWTWRVTIAGLTGVRRGNGHGVARGGQQERLSACSYERRSRHHRAYLPSLYSNLYTVSLQTSPKVDKNLQATELLTTLPFVLHGTGAEIFGLTLELRKSIQACPLPFGQIM